MDLSGRSGADDATMPAMPRPFHRPAVKHVLHLGDGVHCADIKQMQEAEVVVCNCKAPGLPGGLLGALAYL